VKVIHILQMALHIGILYGFYLIGIWTQEALSLAIPGSIIGMLLLFILLLTKILPVSFIESGTSLLIRHMPLLFIPVTVGVMDYFNVFKGEGIWLVVITIISTMIVFVVSGLISQWLVMRKENPDE
jgi:holin-like protein